MSNFKLPITKIIKILYSPLKIGDWTLEIENSSRREAGFSMLELLSVMAIIIFLSGFVVFNLVKTQQHTSSHSAIDTLVTDIKQQQLNAMIATTQGTGTSYPQGIYFQQGDYVLFRGAAYSPSDSTNFTVTLDPNLQFSNIIFPNNSLVFAEGSGEVQNYITGENTVQIKNVSSGETKTLTINQYGTITSIN